MDNIVCFYIDETPTMPGYYVIRTNHEAFHLGPTVGSYNIIQARLFNISYADYLRLCRDDFGATLIGKNTYYPVPYFKNKLAAEAICKTLNSRANFVLWNREHPDYEEHKSYVENWYEDARRRLDAHNARLS